MKYSGRVLISKIDNATGVAVGNETIQNSGTVDLWRLLCGLLKSGETADTAGVTRPEYIDMGYFYTEGEGSRTVVDLTEGNLKKPLPSTDIQYQSIIGTSGNKVMDKQILYELDDTSNTSNPVLNLTAYFSDKSFVSREVTGGHIYITLKDSNSGNKSHILAVASTGASKYEIEDNETHIIKWQLSFQNAKSTTVQGS